jgi:Sulfotransferase domain
MAGRVRVGFVGGLGRSGSTLLELCLGGLAGVCAVGELVHVWERGVAENQLCGCGRHFHDCGFWRQVGGEAFGGWERVDVQRVLALKRSVDRNRFVPRLLTPAPGEAFLRRVREYDGLYRRVLAAVLAVAGAEVVVDSSKHVSTASCLRRDPALDLRLVHVVRDSRGVAHSWSKQVRRPEIAGSVVYMPRYTAGQASLRWLTQNAMLEALAAAGTPRLLVRYEDFVADPAGTLDRVAGHLGVTVPAGRWPGAREVVLGPNHTVAGHPLRFTSGTVPVRADEAWRQQMPLGRRRVVGALTLPLRFRYGYVGDGHEARPPRAAPSPP